MANTLKLGTDNNWAVKEGSLLAYNDENNNFKPLPFDFTRNSGATRVNEQGLIETVGANVPRIDFTDGKGSLLLEPTRTNNLVQSNQFDTTWALTTAIRVTSGYSGVYGSSDAWLLKRVDGGSRYLYQNVSLSNTQTFSIYLKADTTNWAWIFLGGTTSWAYFDLKNGEVGATNSLVDYKIEAISDGWYRCIITADVTLSSVRVYPAQNNLAVSGDSNLGIYIQHAQFEQGSYATSYIPTSGSVATRNQDVCNNGGNEQVINSTEGVLYAEVAGLSNDAVRYSISDGSNSNNIYIELNSSAVTAVGRLGGVNQFSIFSPQTITSYNKIAIKYKQNDFALWFNGVEVGTATSGNTYPSNTLNSFQFDRGDGGVDFYGKTKDVRIYNKALTDAELINLTK